MSEPEPKQRDARLVALDAVWDADGRADVKATVAALFRFLTSEWTTITSIPRLARIAGLDEKTVKARLAALVDAGAITRRDRVGPGGMTSPEWTVRPQVLPAAVSQVSSMRAKHTPPVRRWTPGPCMDPRSVDGPGPGPCMDPPPGPSTDHVPGICSGDLFRGENTPDAPEALAPATAGPECVSPKASGQGSSPGPDRMTVPQAGSTPATAAHGAPDAQPHTSEPASGAGSRGVCTDAVPVEARTAPPTTTETTHERDGTRGPAEGHPRHDDGLDDGGEGGHVGSGGGAAEAGAGSVGSGKGEAAGDGGLVDLAALWSALVAWTPKPGAWKLTEQRRKHLRARIADHDIATVERVAAWVATSADDRAVFLRKRNDPDTLLRRERFDTYAGMSTQTAPAVASPMHRTALAAWDRYIAPLLTDRRYHSQAPPPVYHDDPAKHEVIRRAMYEAGGWAHLSRVRDRAEDVATFRQTFTATLARELECAA